MDNIPAFIMNGTQWGRTGLWLASLMLGIILYMTRRMVGHYARQLSVASKPRQLPVVLRQGRD